MKVQLKDVLVDYTISPLILNYSNCSSTVTRVRGVMQALPTTLPRLLPRKYKSYEEDGNSALHLACYRSDYDSALMLLLASHSMTVRNVWGETPLHQCTAQGHLELMMLLLDAGGRRGCGQTLPHPPMMTLHCVGSHRAWYGDAVNLHWLFSRGVLQGRTPVGCK